MSARAVLIGGGIAGLALVGAEVFAQDASGPAEPTPAQVRSALLEKLPPLELGEDGVETLVVEGAFRAILQRFSLHARGGDEYDLLVTAVDDGQPFLVGRDGVSLAYVPGKERGSVQLFPGLAQIHLAVEEGRLRVGIAMVGAPEDEEDERVLVLLDPASLLRGTTEQLRVEQGAGGRYRLTGTSPAGTRLELDVDPDAAYPVVALRITTRDADEPAVEITRLAVNVEPGARTVGIPTLEALREHFDAEDLRVLDDAKALAAAMGATFSASGARMRMAGLASSRDPAEKAQANRDLRERTKLGELVRTAAAR